MLTEDPVVLPAADRHPLLVALDRALNIMDLNQNDIAREIKVLPQTLTAWKRFAKTNPNYLLPAEQVPPLCVVLAIKPHTLRPDLWPDERWTFRKNDAVHLRSQNYARAVQ